MPDAPLLTGGTGQFVRIAGLKRYFDVSAPWLVRVLEGRPRQILQAVDGIDIEIAKGETLRPGGRIGLRQVDGGAPDGRPLRADRGLDRVRRQRHGGAPQPQRHGGAAPAHADDLPGPVRQPQSALAGVRHRRRADPRLRTVHRQGRSRRARRRAAAPGRPVAGRRPQIPARILRRPAPAHLDRPRARERAGVPGVRRADLGARRLGAGADPQPDGRPAAPPAAHLSLHLAQSGGRPPHLDAGRRDVSRPHGRGGADRHAVPPAASTPIRACCSTPSPTST